MADRARIDFPVLVSTDLEPEEARKQWREAAAKAIEDHFASDPGAVDDWEYIVEAEPIYALHHPEHDELLHVTQTLWLTMRSDLPVARLEDGITRVADQIVEQIVDWGDMGIESPEDELGELDWDAKAL